MPKRKITLTDDEKRAVCAAASTGNLNAPALAFPTQNPNAKPVPAPATFTQKLYGVDSSSSVTPLLPPVTPPSLATPPPLATPSPPLATPVSSLSTSSTRPAIKPPGLNRKTLQTNTLLARPLTSTTLATVSSIACPAVHSSAHPATHSTTHSASFAESLSAEESMYVISRLAAHACGALPHNEYHIQLSGEFPPHTTPPISTNASAETSTSTHSLFPKLTRSDASPPPRSSMQSIPAGSASDEDVDATFPLYSAPINFVSATPAHAFSSLASSHANPFMDLHSSPVNTSMLLPSLPLNSSYAAAPRVSSIEHAPDEVACVITRSTEYKDTKMSKVQYPFIVQTNKGIAFMCCGQNGLHGTLAHCTICYRLGSTKCMSCKNTYCDQCAPIVMRIGTPHDTYCMACSTNPDQSALARMIHEKTPSSVIIHKMLKRKYQLSMDYYRLEREEYMRLLRSDAMSSRLAVRCPYRRSAPSNLKRPYTFDDNR